MATHPTDSPSKRRKRKPALRKLVEFKGMSRLSLQQYRNDVKQLYDGPKGAVLAMASLVSLHEPLMGLMLRERKFDATRFHKILDVGSGAGQLLGHLIKTANPSADLIGCDLSHQMLRRARTRLNSKRPAYVTADLTQLPFDDNAFDCITCGWVIEHLHDPRPGLREFVRVLQPGGSILLLATEDTVAGAFTSRTWKCRTYNRRELNRICEEVGLPWREQLYFTKLHRFLKMGGILVEATKQADSNVPMELESRGARRCQS